MASTISSDEVLTHIEEQVSLVLKQRGVSPNIIAAAAMAVSDGISEVFGGQLVYFKQQRTLSSEERNLALLADFETGNYSRGELAQKYGISVQRVYKIIRDNKEKTAWI